MHARPVYLFVLLAILPPHSYRMRQTSTWVQVTAGLDTPNLAANTAAHRRSRPLVAGDLVSLGGRMCTRALGSVKMTTLQRWQHLLLAIGLLYVSSSAAQLSAAPARTGETIKMGSYVVTAPAGNGWRIQKDPIKDLLLFQRDDPATIISVAPQSLADSSQTIDEDNVAATVFDFEERNMRDKGLSRSYAPSGFSRELLVISGKTVHVMRYSVTQLGLRPPLNPVLMKYAMYLYLPGNWKESKRWYAFVIGAPQEMGGTNSAPAVKDIESIIATFQPL
jgi:hypothetical protein